MIPQSRGPQASLIDTPYDHCISRFVRRAFLCGEDKLTEKSFSHRRQWVAQRMHFLASVFSIDICAYRILSSHHHVILHIDTDGNAKLSNEEVCQRCCQLYSAPPSVDRWIKQQLNSQIEQDIAMEIIDI